MKIEDAEIVVLATDCGFSVESFKNVFNGPSMTCISQCSKLKFSLAYLGKSSSFSYEYDVDAPGHILDIKDLLVRKCRARLDFFKRTFLWKEQNCISVNAQSPRRRNFILLDSTESEFLKDFLITVAAQCRKASGATYG